MGLRYKMKLTAMMNKLRIFALYHVVISPPKERYAEDDDHGDVINHLRKAALKKARQYAWGGYAGVIVPQLWGNRWVGEGWGTWGPHAHLLCLGVRFEHYESNDEGLHVQVVRGRKGGPFSTIRGESILHVMLYLLDHAPIVPGVPAVVPFGDFRRKSNVPQKKTPVATSIDDLENEGGDRPPDRMGNEDLR